MKRFRFAVCIITLLCATAFTAGVANAEWIELPVKWSQPPDMQIGRDHLSIHCTPIVADDFISEDESPVVAVRWWGSYLGYDGYPPPDYQPPGGFSVPFHISFYTDVPFGADPKTPWSHPGELLLEQVVYAQEEEFAVVDDPEFVFMYNAYLKTPFYQGRYHEPTGKPTIFWIAIDRLDRKDWGWHEATTLNIDDAVTGPHAGPWMRLFKVKEPDISADMAFELLVPEPATLILLSGMSLFAIVRRRR